MANTCLVKKWSNLFSSASQHEELKNILFWNSLCSFSAMAPLLLKHLATSLARQVAQMSHWRLTLSSPAAFVHRSLFMLTGGPRAFLPSSASISSIQLPSSGFPARRETSLLGQCRHVPCVQLSAGMKTKTALKRRCKDCFFVIRRGRLFVFCKTNPRHKQRQGWSVVRAWGWLHPRRGYLRKLCWSNKLFGWKILWSLLTSLQFLS